MAEYRQDWLDRQNELQNKCPEDLSIIACTADATSQAREEFEAESAETAAKEKAAYQKYLVLNEASWDCSSAASAGEPYTPSPEVAEYLAEDNASETPLMGFFTGVIDAGTDAVTEFLDFTERLFTDPAGIVSEMSAGLTALLEKIGAAYEHNGVLGAIGELVLILNPFDTLWESSVNAVDAITRGDFRELGRNSAIIGAEIGAFLLGLAVVKKLGYLQKLAKAGRKVAKKIPDSVRKGYKQTKEAVDEIGDAKDAYDDATSHLPEKEGGQEPMVESESDSPVFRGRVVKTPDDIKR